MSVCLTDFHVQYIKTNINQLYKVNSEDRVCYTNLDLFRRNKDFFRILSFKPLLCFHFISERWNIQGDSKFITLSKLRCSVLIKLSWICYRIIFQKIPPTFKRGIKKTI